MTSPWPSDPPDGRWPWTRYIKDETIEYLRQEAFAAEEMGCMVEIAPQMALEIVCDLRNMAQEISEKGA